MAKPVKNILFDHTSANLDSPVFSIGEQVTVVALGMAPGDTITFEIISLASGDPSSICGCLLSKATGATIAGVQPLLCPSCESDGPVEVTLSENNPVVILDWPQGALVRAIYHGTGVNDRTAVVWYNVTNTHDVTDSMRGCVPPCCMDEDEVWAETGLQRCTDTDVELQQISNCGNYRWIVDEPVEWIDTGQFRCLPPAQGSAQLLTEIEQTNQCGERRWIEGPPYTWVDTGETRCVGSNHQSRQMTPCGEFRWVTTGPVLWVRTGFWQCIDGVRHWQETNQCGQLRWTASGDSCAVIRLCPNTPLYGDGSEQNPLCLDIPDLGERLEGLVPIITCNDERITGDGTFDDPLCVELDEQVAIAVCEDSGLTGDGTADNPLCLNLADMIISGDDCIIVEPQPNGQIIIRLDGCGDGPPTPSDHTASLSVAPTTGAEGSSFTFTVGLDSPVTGSTLAVQVALSGSEQTDHGYATPRVVNIGVGQTSGTFVVNTVNDAAGGPNTTLTGTVVSNPRLSNTPTASATVTPTSAPDSQHTVVSVTPVANPIAQGQNACWDVTLNTPVTGNPLTINFTLSGPEQIDNGYPSPSLIIPIGQSSGQVCVLTDNDSTEDDQDLCLQANLSARITGRPAPSCITVSGEEVPDIDWLTGALPFVNCCATEGGPTPPNGWINFSSAGTAAAGTFCSGDTTDNWLSPGGNAANWEIGLFINSNCSTEGSGQVNILGSATGTYLPASGSPSWTFNLPSNGGSGTVYATVRIRRVGGSSDVATAPVWFNGTTGTFCETC